MMSVILFDDGVGSGSATFDLSPMTDLRPSFAVRTGALTTRQRWMRALGAANLAGLWVRADHAAMAREHVASAGGDASTVNGLASSLAAATADALSVGVIIANGRCVLPPMRDQIDALKVGDALVEPGTGQIVAMRAGAAQMQEAFAAFAAAGTPAWPRPIKVVELAAPCLLHRPWHVRTFRDAAIAHDLKYLSQYHTVVPGVGSVAGIGPSGSIRFGSSPLAINPSAKIYPGVTFDLEAGPIVIAEHAVIRPGATLIGPVYIGAHSTVLDKALIKSNTAIGEHCKIAGEVGGTIFHGFANKAHDGHLGDSWIGKWANLGAGTTNSNLLNTYAEVAMRATPRSSMERTGQQFMGCILGDHVKTAICTRIMTGTIMQTGVMYAATAPATGCIPAFSWCTDAAAGTLQAASPATPPRFRLDKFLAIARTVMARRKVALSAASEAALTRRFADAAV